MQAAQIAKSAGVPVLLDAGGVEGPISPELLACLAVLSPNETELSRLTGLPTETLAQVQVAAEALMALGVQSVLVKLGADGSLLLPGGFSPPSCSAQAPSLPRFPHAVSLAAPLGRFAPAADGSFMLCPSALTGPPQASHRATDRATS